MSISIPHIPPVNARGAGIYQPSPRPRTGLASFTELLNQTILQRDGGDEAQTLPKDKIIALLQDIRAQMDDQLMRALSPDEKEDTCLQPALFLPLMDRHAMPEIESSNNRRTAQNLDSSSGPTHLDAVIADAAQTHGVDPALIRSVIKVESDFKMNCTSPKGAMGLMQLMPETARELGVRNGYDPVQNVEAGTRYLKMLLNRYDGNISLALAAYNWGMGNLEKRAGQMPAETRRYVERVTRHYASLQT